LKAHEYRDLIASYIDRVFGRRGLVVYTEISLGKTIIGKNRRIDVFVLRAADQQALALECKTQESGGTTDEKIPYALQDLEALWVPGCLVYGGEGWSSGVMHTLRSSKRAVHCLPRLPALERTKETLRARSCGGCGLRTVGLRTAGRSHLLGGATTLLAPEGPAQGGTHS
jgi:hypothetical protein